MKNMLKPSLAGMLLLALLTFAFPALAKDMSESELIAQLASPTAGKVTDALQGLEKQYPTSTNGFAAMKKLLTDDRAKVRRKAARVLGVLHAEVDEANIQAICKLLKASDVDEVTDGLKALRGLKAPSAVPEILPVLKSPTPNLVRDACRTLAVLGDKSVIPSIEPLLKDPNAKVQADAQEAIYILKQKP